MRLLHLVFLSMLLALLFDAKQGVAQEFKLKGAIFEFDSKIRIGLAVITNKRNLSSVGSNDIGLFEIRAMVGDTLVITKRRYNDLQLVVVSTKDIVLYLKREEILREIVVEGESKKQALDAIEKDFKNKGSFYAGKPPIALLSPFGGSPLTFFYELFGKTPRDARRFRKYHQTELKEFHTDGFFNKKIVHENTGLEGKELEDFMLNYRPDYEKTKNWTVYDGIKWIKDSYKKYTATLK
jgi:hypothetical protein